MQNYTGGPVDPNDPNNIPVWPEDVPDASGTVGGGPAVPGTPGPGQASISAPTSGQNPTGNVNTAEELLINYNEKFRAAGPTLFRDQIVYQLSAVLIGKNKPNGLLVGPAGTGKTKIVEDLAWRLESKDPVIPDKLRGSVVYELPLSNIVAGSSLVGQMEDKLKSVMEFFQEDPHRILFIDEIHQLCGDPQTYGKIAQIIKPYLARGEVRVIGATTSQEAGLLMDDPALNRRFSRIIVDEFTQAQTIEVLKSMKNSFFQHYDRKPLIDDTLLETVVKLSDLYSPAGSHRPDNAITLLDRAIGEAMVNHKFMLQNAQSNPTALQALQAIQHIRITPENVKRTAMRIMTGNAKKHDFDMARMRAALVPIKGQDDAVECILERMRQQDLALFPTNKPLTMLLAGMSGVGKTEITKIIAKDMTGVPPVILNMTEYHDSASINRIIGAPPGYVGSDSNAELPFDCLEANPYQIILLDEFEKADRSVQRLFMAAFDEGFIKTNRGKLVDFSKAIIIATTNAGHTNDRHKPLGFASGGNDKAATVQETVQTLSKYFDTELLNRFKEIITFKAMTESVYREILRDQYAKEKARLAVDKPRLVLPDDISDDELDDIVRRTYVPEFGARPAAKAVENYIESHV